MLLIDPSIIQVLTVWLPPQAAFTHLSPVAITRSANRRLRKQGFIKTRWRHFLRTGDILESSPDNEGPPGTGSLLEI
jgi:hypothetical protein